MPKQFLPAIVTVLTGLLLAGCGHSGSGVGGGSTISSPSASREGQTAARVDQQSGAPLLPDAKMTPGDTLDVTVQDLCVPGYTQKVRNVPQSVKNQVYAEYGIRHHQSGEFEVDHLISLELGGSNSVRNLWPQSYRTQPWNAHVKDALENKLHGMVCSGQLDLKTAQHDIATDWIAAYKKYLGAGPSVSGGASPGGGSGPRRRLPALQPLTVSPAGGGDVWVNTHSGKYFHSGSPYYGHTKQGEYLTEDQAQQQGYTAARGQ